MKAGRDQQIDQRGKTRRRTPRTPRENDIYAENPILSAIHKSSTKIESSPEVITTAICMQITFQHVLLRYF